jgi:hypothetical protein
VIEFPTLKEDGAGDGDTKVTRITGVPEAIVDGVPVADPFKAVTLKSYEVPFASPVTMADVLVDTPSENMANEPPEVGLDSIW